LFTFAGHVVREGCGGGWAQGGILMSGSWVTGKSDSGKLGVA
jgi:hypothetical protein